MNTTTRDLTDRTLLAPARLIERTPLASGYDMGFAATAAFLRFELPAFPMSDSEAELVERALTAIEDARTAYHWRQPLTADEVADLEAGEPLPVRTIAERLREERLRADKIRRAVAAGDEALPALAQHGLAVFVTTRPEILVPLPRTMDRSYPFSAVVHVERTR